MQKSSIQVVTITEMLIKRKKLNILTKNLTCYQFKIVESKINFNQTQMDFDVTSLCPSAMWDKNSVYPKIKKWLCI